MNRTRRFQFLLYKCVFYLSFSSSTWLFSPLLRPPFFFIALFSLCFPPSSEKILLLFLFLLRVIPFLLLQRSKKNTKKSRSFHHNNNVFFFLFDTFNTLTPFASHKIITKRRRKRTFFHVFKSCVWGWEGGWHQRMGGDIRKSGFFFVTHTLNSKLAAVVVSLWHDTRETNNMRPFFRGYPVGNFFPEVDHTFS